MIHSHRTQFKALQIINTNKKKLKRIDIFMNRLIILLRQKYNRKTSELQNTQNRNNSCSNVVLLLKNNCFYPFKSHGAF